MIEVKQTDNGDPMKFYVTVKDENGETRHRATMTQATYHQLTDEKVNADRCIQAAFEFLLDREPKESILPQFDLTVISRYFPTFERDIAKYLQSKQES